MNAIGAGMLNIPEYTNPVRPFYVEQGFPGSRIAVLQFLDFPPLEPEAAATALTGLRLDTRDLQEFQFVVARRTVHRVIILYE